jgi:hypothetical protein
VEGYEPDHLPRSSVCGSYHYQPVSARSGSRRALEKAHLNRQQRALEFKRDQRPIRQPNISPGSNTASTRIFSRVVVGVPIFVGKKNIKIPPITQTGPKVASLTE